MIYMPDLFKEIMSSYPHIKEWYEHMKTIPEVSEVRSYLVKVVPKFLKSLERKKQKEMNPKL